MSNNDKLCQLYAHYSRLYNSSVNVLIAISFGWLPFISLAFSQIADGEDFFGINTYNSIFNERSIFATIGLIILIMVFLISYRILRFSKWIKKIENDFNLEEYKRTLPPLLLSKFFDKGVGPLHIGQWLGVIIVSLYFTIPFALLLVKVLS